MTAIITKGGAEVDEAQNRELDTMTAMLKFAKVVAKVAAREITGHRLTDDEYIEMFRKEGGKPLQKAVREKLAPAMGFTPTGSKGKSRAKARKTRRNRQVSRERQQTRTVVQRRLFPIKDAADYMGFSPLDRERDHMERGHTLY